MHNAFNAGLLYYLKSFFKHLFLEIENIQTTTLVDGDKDLF